MHSHVLGADQNVEYICFTGPHIEASGYTLLTIPITNFSAWSCLYPHDLRNTLQFSLASLSRLD